jgi:chromosome partitioning protein
MFRTFIPKNISLGEASFYGKAAIMYKVNSRGSVAYLTLAREIIAHTREEQTLKIEPSIVQAAAPQTQTVI